VSWINDWRGKPCQWVEEFVLPDEHVQWTAFDDWQASPEYYARAQEAMERCKADFDALHADPNSFYVVRVEPECVQVTKDKVHSLVVRARVHWCATQAEAEQQVKFEEHLMSEVDKQWMAPT
jgi:hypothetical protein